MASDLKDHDFIEAWRNFSPSHPPYLLPGDERVLDDRLRFKEFRTLDEYTKSDCFGERTDTTLHLGLLPQPFFGCLEKASVFILGLNPGLSPLSYFAEDLDYFRGELLRTLKIKSDRCLMLNQVFAWYGGFSYWQRKLGKIVTRLSKTWGVTYGLALDRLAQSVATVELLPYHSFRFKISRKLLNQLNSVQLVKRYVHEVLVPKADRGEALIIVGRKAKVWELPPAANIIVYDRSEARGVPLSPGSRGGRSLLRFLERATTWEPVQLKPAPDKWVGEWNNA